MMQPLNKGLRGQLECAVQDAHDAAESTACVALEQLGVGEALPFAHLDGQDRGVDGAQEKPGAAEHLRKNLEMISEGEAPHDIFARWKLLEQQPIGWNPDLNDGARLNLRPFLSVSDVRKKDAGVLRDKPNINWKKDRGKDVESAPWYHLDPTYGGKEGDRINDHHLTLAKKRADREATE